MSEKIVHYFEYGDKKIPLSYDSEGIQDRLQECIKVVDLFLQYIKTENIIFDEKDKKLLIAEEDICSSYIEGYETYLTPEYLIKGFTSGSLADKATHAGFNAYLYAFEKYLESIENLDTNGIVDIWKKLIKYKKFFRRKIRKTGVRVGNKQRTSHIAPPAKYVNKLLDDMFVSLKGYGNEELDKYGFVKSILFHYIFTFIHPFIDGNGRSARLIEQLMFLKSSGLPCCVPLSTIILKDRKAYYKTFNSGQKFGEGPFDILSIDITDFINYNLYTIEMGILEVLKLKECVVTYQDLPILEVEDVKGIINRIGCSSVEDFKKYLNNTNLYCKYLISGKISETEFGLKFNFDNYEKYDEIISKKWVESEGDLNA